MQNNKKNAQSVTYKIFKWKMQKINEQKAI